MFKRFFQPDIRGWQVGERKIQFIMYLINKFILLGILEVAIYFVLIMLKYKLKMDFLNTSEYITLIGTVDTFYLGVAGVLSGVYTYGNAQEWKNRPFNLNDNTNQNQNIVSPNINISVKKPPSETPNNPVFNPPKGDV